MYLSPAAVLYLWGGEHYSPGSAWLIFSAVLWPFPLIDVTVRACLYCRATTADWLITRQASSEALTWISKHLSCLDYIWDGRTQFGGFSKPKCPRPSIKHYSTDQCTSEGNIQLWNQDNSTFLQQEQNQADLLPSVPTSTMQIGSVGWERCWQHLKGNGVEQSSWILPPLANFHQNNNKTHDTHTKRAQTKPSNQPTPKQNLNFKKGK